MSANRDDDGRIDRQEYLRRRGGDKAPLERAADVAPPEHQAVQHGLYLSGSTYFPCDRCVLRDRCPAFEEGGSCELERQYTGERARQIRAALAEAGQDPALHEALVMSAVLAELRLARVTRFLSATGEFLAGGDAGYAEYQPAAREVPKVQRELRDSLAALNLTPAAIAKLEAERPVAGSPMQAMVRALESRQGATGLEGGEGSEGQAQEVEFESEEEDPVEE